MFVWHFEVDEESSAWLEFGPERTHGPVRTALKIAYVTPLVCGTDSVDLV